MKNILVGSDIVKDFKEKGYTYILKNIDSYIYSVKQFESSEEYNKEVNELADNNILFVNIKLFQFIKLSRYLLR